MIQNTKEIKKPLQNPLDISARFLDARPDLVGAWIIGMHGLLPIFKSEHKEAIIAYLETVQSEFFSALRHRWEKRHPEQNLVYTFGTICRNNKGDERLVVGLKPEKDAKPKYEYVDGTGMLGMCNEASMKSWMEKI